MTAEGNTEGNSASEHALVRARVRDDLEAFGARTDAPAPTETPQRDYRFRTSVPFATLAAELAAQAAAIDYPNFKSEVAARQGHDRAHRSSVCGSGSRP